MCNCVMDVSVTGDVVIPFVVFLELTDVISSRIPVDIKDLLFPPLLLCRARPSSAKTHFPRFCI